MFSLTVEDEAECIEEYETFKCLGRILDRYNEDWLEVLRNVSKARRVWNRLGKLLQQEGDNHECPPFFIKRRSSWSSFLGRRSGFCQKRFPGS